MVSLLKTAQDDHVFHQVQIKTIFIFFIYLFFLNVSKFSSRSSSIRLFASYLLSTGKKNKNCSILLTQCLLQRERKEKKKKRETARCLATVYLCGEWTIHSGLNQGIQRKQMQNNNTFTPTAKPQEAILVTTHNM